MSFVLSFFVYRLGPCELPLPDQWLSHSSASHLSQQSINPLLLSPRAANNNNNINTNNNNITNNNNFGIPQQQVTDHCIGQISLITLESTMPSSTNKLRCWSFVNVFGQFLSLSPYFRHKCNNNRRIINKLIRLLRIRRK